MYNNTYNISVNYFNYFIHCSDNLITLWPVKLQIYAFSCSLKINQRLDHVMYYL